MRVRVRRPGSLLAAMVLLATQLAATGCTDVSDTSHEPGVVRQQKCLSCHEAERKSAVHPPHGSLPTTCQDCHSEGHWVPAELSSGHPWPLEGEHARSLCASCHVGEPPVYEGTPTLCVGCHQDDYDLSPAPGHDAFPTTCEGCHSTEQWVPALSALDHPWPLDGAHAQVSCLGCHVGTPPVYQGASTVCVGCHQSDYDNSPYPGHSDFATTCENCHTTTAWTPATGGKHPEDAFPIESGAHSKYRDDCVSCHNSDLGSPAGGEDTDCVGCHDGDHSRAKMDAKHNEEPDYPNGTAPPNFCLDCHADGRN
jgi:hypothetical protein